jgi:hypothetical protein
MGSVFTIKYVTEMKDEDGTDNNFGETLGDERTIKINLTNHNSDDEIERTLLHEIIHATLFMGGQNENLGDREEGVVRCLENGLSQLYKRVG